ncbi:MAG: sensor histidine kinase [Calditrichia bacterium]
MLQNWVVIFTSFGYLAVLFAIAYYGDRRASMQRSVISNPYIYALSLAVYCTAWTFYGSVGRAANSGVGFLPIYLGPTLIITLWWVVMRKIIRISKKNRITSIADFVASRYGKSNLLGGTVTVIAVIGIVPYISLQLKAISISFQIISGYPNVIMPAQSSSLGLNDTTLSIAMILAVFTILFGTRHLDATERHEGLVAAIAFESVVKLIAFLAVGLFVTYSMYDGFGDIFQRAAQHDDLQKLFGFSDVSGTQADWILLLIVSMMAIMFLPRQFQVTVIENVNEKHLGKAIWLFPLYMLVINIFVLPIALGGLMHFAGQNVDADTFVLTLPMIAQQEWLTLLVFIGGLSAATGMVIVETIALSTMICNDLVMPLLLRLKFLRLTERKDLTGLLLAIRRGSIILVMLMGYFYFHFVGEFFSLVSIGLTSFVAVAQFAPAILGGIFWKQGSRHGAMTGLIIGFAVWAFTLPFPSMVRAGLFSETIITQGLFGIELLRPFHLFGLEGFGQISHSVFWSLLLNTIGYVTVSLFSRQSGIELNQASLFVDIFKYTGGVEVSSIWRGTASASARDLHDLLRRFLGKRRTDEVFTEYAEVHKINWQKSIIADTDFVNHTEQVLAGAVGSATARGLIGAVVKEEPLSLDEVVEILNETQQVLAHTRELEEKSRELEELTGELQAANQRLQELDRMKDDFVSTVTHELRTPLTSVRAFSEILYDNPELDINQRQHFLSIIIKESERLTRLINQVLDLQKMESHTLDWKISQVDISEVIRDAMAATSQLLAEKRIKTAVDLPEKPAFIRGDRDRLMQVMLNLISNAIKFCDSQTGKINLRLQQISDHVQIDVQDNGIGIRREDQEIIFEKFHQVHGEVGSQPGGSGLGLAITRRIIEFHQGKIWVKSAPGKGSTFSFTLSRADQSAETEVNQSAGDQK